MLLTTEQRSALKDLKREMTGLLGEDMVALKLFGSRAREDADPGADVDVVAVVRDLSRGRRRLILDRVAEIELKWLTPLSLLLLDQSDFDQLRLRERRIALDIEREGVSL
jgi:predicted nucleotidyltransferase